MSSPELRITTFSEMDHPDIRATEKWTTVPNCGEIPNFGPGCPLGCCYCNQMALDIGEDGEKLAGYLFPGIDGGMSINSRLMIGKNLVKEISNQTLLEEIGKYRFYSPECSVIINNFSDPGLNWTQSIELARLLVEKFGHTGAITFITKMGIGEKAIQEFQELIKIGGKPMVIVTYSGLNQSIEPASGKARINTIRKLKESGIPVILSMRPMIEGQNTDNDTITHVLTEAGQYADAITASGLYVYHPFTIENFAKSGNPLGKVYQDHRYSVAKVMPENLYKNIRNLAKKLGIKTPIFEHTTCAVATIQTLIYRTPISDRLAHWAIEEESCQECPQLQREQCESSKTISLLDIITKAEKALSDLGYDLPIIQSEKNPHMLLVEGGSLVIGELFYIMEKSGWRVDNLPTLEGLVYRTIQAIEQDFGGSRKMITAALPNGQEWTLFVEGEALSQKDVEILTSWIRSRNRARITVNALSD